MSVRRYSPQRISPLALVMRTLFRYRLKVVPVSSLKMRLQIIGGQGNGAGGILQRQVLRIVGPYVLDAFMYDIGMLGVRVGLDAVHKTVNRMVQPVAQGAEAAQEGMVFWQIWLKSIVSSSSALFSAAVREIDDDKLRSPGFHPVQPSASGSQKGGKQFLELLSGAFPIPV